MKRLLFLFLIVISGVVVGFLSLSRPKPPPSSTPLPPPQAAWMGIGPGDTQGDVVERLGQPKKIDLGTDESKMYYQGESSYWDTTVVVRDDVVSFVREHVFATQSASLSSRLALVGGQGVKLYGRESAYGQYVLAFADLGVAFLANEPSDVVYEVWYFKPAPLGTILLLPEFRGYSTSELTGGNAR